MHIEGALKLIRVALKNDIVESTHFKEQCKERNLNSVDVKNIVQKTNLVGILDQKSNRYRLWFTHTTEKDLNVIVQIINNRLRLITVFPSDIARSVKEGE